MNNARRKILREIIDNLEAQNELLQSCAEEERDYLDNIPENLQESTKYANAEENVEDLDSAVESLNEAIESIQSAIDR